MDKNIGVKEMKRIDAMEVGEYMEDEAMDAMEESLEMMEEEEGSRKLRWR